MECVALSSDPLVFLTRCLPMCFRGVGPGCNTREIADKLIDLKAELDDLAVREHELDQQRVWVQQSIKNVTDDSNNSPYPSQPGARVYLCEEDGVTCLVLLYNLLDFVFLFFGKCMLKW